MQASENLHTTGLMRRSKRGYSISSNELGEYPRDRPAASSV